MGLPTWNAIWNQLLFRQEALGGCEAWRDLSRPCRVSSGPVSQAAKPQGPNPNCKGTGAATRGLAQCTARQRTE